MQGAHLCAQSTRATYKAPSPTRSIQEHPIPHAHGLHYRPSAGEAVVPLSRPRTLGLAPMRCRRGGLAGFGVHGSTCAPRPLESSPPHAPSALMGGTTGPLRGRWCLYPEPARCALRVRDADEEGTQGLFLGVNVCYSPSRARPCTLHRTRDGCPMPRCYGITVFIGVLGVRTVVLSV